MNSKLLPLCVACVILVGTAVTFGGLKSEAVEAGADYVIRKFGKDVTKELGEEGAELLATKMETLAAKYGEKETVSAVEKVGPRAFRLVEEVGEDSAPKAIKLMDRVGEDSIWIIARKKSMAIFLKYGDDAADAMIKHKEIAEELIEQFGPSSARALKAVGGQNARRLAMMAEDGKLAAVPQKTELLETIGKYGDGAMNWVWNNKGALATTAILAKFIQNPQPFIDGTVKVVDVGGEKLIKPVTTELASGIAKNTDWTVVILTLIGVAFMLTLFLVWRWRHRPERGPTCH